MCVYRWYVCVDSSVNITFYFIHLQVFKYYSVLSNYKIGEHKRKLVEINICSARNLMC